MTSWLSRILPAAVAAAALTGPPAAFADDPGQPPPGVEVLARGPVHEAYATTVEMPTAGPVVQKAPPAPIEELPPDQKPAGDNVQWLPGYWHWDEDRTDFVWISGFWRVPPPGRVWVPGSWREVPGGFQWVQGFWQDAAPVAPAGGVAPVQAAIDYLPPPPQPLDAAPNVPAPTPTSIYVPGNWVWRGRYVWRPGVWVDYRPGWVWVPAHFRWTPVGYVYVEGYWDYPLDGRGVMFAPVAFAPGVYVRPGFVYTPTYVVATNSMYGAMFVRRGFGCYYFGDYFEPRYATLGYSSWCGAYHGTTFSLSIGFGRGVPYDPLWSYYRVEHHADPVWARQVTEVYGGRYQGTVPRPSRTVVINNVTNVTNVTNNVTNVTNNKTVVNNIANTSMVTNIKNVNNTTNSHVTLKPVAAAERVQEQQHAAALNQVATQRRQLETGLVARGATPTAPAAHVQPQQVKLTVPQAVAARAQVPAPAAKAPPPPATHVQTPVHQPPPTVHPMGTPATPPTGTVPKGPTPPPTGTMPKGPTPPPTVPPGATPPKGPMPPATPPKGPATPPKNEKKP